MGPRIHKLHPENNLLVVGLLLSDHWDYMQVLATNISPVRTSNEFTINLTEQVLLRVVASAMILGIILSKTPIRREIKNMFRKEQQRVIPNFQYRTGNKLDFYTIKSAYLSIN